MVCDQMPQHITPHRTRARRSRTLPVAVPTEFANLHSFMRVEIERGRILVRSNRLCSGRRRACSRSIIVRCQRSRDRSIRSGRGSTAGLGRGRMMDLMRRESDHRCVGCLLTFIILCVVIQHILDRHPSHHVTSHRASVRGWPHTDQHTCCCCPPPPPLPPPPPPPPPL